MSWWGKPAVFALPPYIRLTKLITEVILPEITKPLVLFIDEIERTMILPFREHFFEWLTTLYESRATDSILYRLSFVVCGVATPSQLIPEGGPLLFQWSHRVVLSDFTLQEALPLAEGLSLPTDAANEAVTWVYRWTEGHPYLTQLLCQLLEEQHRMAWLETEVDECIRHFIVSPQGLREPNFQFVRRALTEPDVNGASLLEPYLDLLEGKTENLKTNPVALEQLRLVGVLREDDEEIAIRNILYQEAFPIEWVKRHLRPPTSAPQPVVSPLPATQHSYVMAASLFLLGVGLLVWFFGTPVSVPLSVTSQQLAPSVSIEPPPTSALTEIPQTPQQPQALAQAQEKIQELEATIVRYQQLSTDEVESLIDQRTQLETELASKEDKLSDLQDQVQTLESRLVDQRDAHEQMIADLQTERTKLQTKATATTKELNTALENVKTLQMAVLKKSSLSPSEINKLMANRSQLETQLQKTNTELALAHERARGLEARLTQQQQLMQTENQRLVEDRSQQEAKLKRLETALADTHQRLSTKEATAQEQAELARSELNRLQKDRTKYQELLSTNQQELSSLKNQTVNLESTLAKKDQAIQEEKGERDRLNTELSQTRQELNSAKTQVATLGDQLSAAMAQVAHNQNALQAIHASSSEQTRRSEEQVTELASARSGLQARLQESQTALIQAQKQIKQLENNSTKISETQNTLRKTTEGISICRNFKVQSNNWPRPKKISRGWNNHYVLYPLQPRSVELTPHALRHLTNPCGPALLLKRTLSR
jgi:hypothetical protein